MGSSKDVKKAPDESTDKVIETFDTLTEPKNVIQWKAIKTPLAIATQAMVLSTRKLCLRTQSTKPRPIVANVIRYQTKGIAETLIKAPKMAVNPKMTTIK
jgi:hypothetical protein